MTRKTGGNAGARAYPEALGRAIKVRRTELGLSRKELAVLAGISYPYLSDIESGRRRASSSALEGVARGLGMTLSSLLARAERYLEEEGGPRRDEPGALSHRGRPFQASAFEAHALELRSMPTAAARYSLSVPPYEGRLLAEEDAGRLRDELHQLVEELPPGDLRLVLQLLRRLAQWRAES